jgi:DNA-binding protein YbaB
MNTEIVGTARKGGVTVEVYPGGALSSITLSEHALTLGTRELAASVLGAVAEAAAQANQRTKHALGDALTVLGYDSDAELVELVEATTPDSWRV